MVDLSEKILAASQVIDGQRDQIKDLQATNALLEAVRAAVKVALDAEYRGRIYRISYRMPEGVNTIECVLCDAEMENEGLLDYETEFSHHDYCAVRGILAAYRAATALIDGEGAKV